MIYENKIVLGIVVCNCKLAEGGVNVIILTKKEEVGGTPVKVISATGGVNWGPVEVDPLTVTGYPVPLTDSVGCVEGGFAINNSSVHYNQ